MTAIASQVFPDLKDIPENADSFASQEFNPNNSAAMIYSLQADVSAMTDSTQGTLTVMGSNISDQETDMVAVTNESGNSGAMPLAQPFVGRPFPYKYIGVKYTAGANVGAGTLTVHYEQKTQKVSIS